MRDRWAFTSCHKAFTAFFARGRERSLLFAIASIRVLSLEHSYAFDVLSEPTHRLIVIEKGCAGQCFLDACRRKIYCRQYISVAFLSLDSTRLRRILPFLTFWLFLFLQLWFRLLILINSEVTLSFIEVIQLNLTDLRRLIACKLSLGAIQWLCR